MGLTNEHVGPKILAKIKIYVLIRAELLFTLCYEIPCIRIKCNQLKKGIKLVDETQISKPQEYTSTGYLIAKSKK